MSLDDAKAHHSSDKPAQLQAHAYAQGTDIHLGPRQEIGNNLVRLNK
jgi:hypothetical protein